MPIESSHNISGARPVGAVDARIVRTAAGAKDQQAIGASPATNPTATSATGAAYQPSTALDPGQVPVDAERVQFIRHAIETGAYPVLPAKIADAMIAAGMLLRAPA
jgi:negative regulator of flagellin synthesis FlgM